MNDEIRYGMMSGAGLCCWILVEFFLGFHTSILEIGQYSGYFSFLIPVVVIYVALKDQQRRFHGSLPIKVGINTGFQIAILSAFIYSLFLFLYNNYINPNWIDAMIDWQRRNLILSGATDDEIGRFMEQNRRMNGAVSQGIMSFISATGMGVFVTMIEILFLRLRSR